MNKAPWFLALLILASCNEAPVVVDGAVPETNPDSSHVEDPALTTVDTELLYTDSTVVDSMGMKVDVANGAERAAQQDGSAEDEAFNKLGDMASADEGLVVEEIEVNFDHGAFDALLRKYVSRLGAVNYDGFKGKPEFDTYLASLSANPPRDDWPKQERMAYWINAYNAFTIKLMIDHMPIESIKDIGNPWKKKFFQIDGVDYDLNTIEHEILRKQFNDPRIHFAINCASASCPKLLNMTFEFRKLEYQLDKTARDFVNDPFRNKITPDDIEISKIFDWFKADFTNKNTTIIKYLNKYSNVVILEEAKVGYKSYDWSLNNK